MSKLQIKQAVEGINQYSRQHMVVVVLPDPFRGMGARRNST